MSDEGHGPDCWRSHLDCAVRRVEELEREREVLQASWQDALKLTEGKLAEAVQRAERWKGEALTLAEACVIGRRRLGKSGWFCLLCRMWWSLNTSPVHAEANGNLDDCPLLAGLNEEAPK